SFGTAGSSQIAFKYQRYLTRGVNVTLSSIHHYQCGQFQPVLDFSGMVMLPVSRDLDEWMVPPALTIMTETIAMIRHTVDKIRRCCSGCCKLFQMFERAVIIRIISCQR